MDLREFLASPVRIIRWIARIWSLLLFAFALFAFFSPDPYATQPVPAADWFLMAFWAVAILALLLAWKWELLGAVVAIATMLLRELAWVLLKGPWLPAFLLIWLVVLPPAILYLVAWRLDRYEVGQAGGI
jgi:hypothetical protein